MDEPCCPPSSERNSATVRARSPKTMMIDSGKSVAHLRTEHNVADFFTKPLVGDHYKRFREFLMGKPVESSYLLTLRTAFEHRPTITNSKCNCSAAMIYSRQLAAMG